MFKSVSTTVEIKGFRKRVLVPPTEGKCSQLHEILGGWSSSVEVKSLFSKSFFVGVVLGLFVGGGENTLILGF